MAFAPVNAGLMLHAIPLQPMGSDGPLTGCDDLLDAASINGESFRLKDKRKARLLGKTTKL